jgi:RHS repeat-associated protein
VGPTGDANYGIPIVVPPGRAGVQPSLSLSYSSRAGNGELGVGWSLAGRSEIRRCRSSLSTEGVVDGVDFDLTDAFCLDGQKLVKIGVAPGGSEYRTERDSFARILSNGGGAALPNYPDSFDVYAKSGRVYHYAPQAAPRTAVDPATGEVQLAGSATAVWLLTEERDRSGNTISYEYAVLPANDAPWDFEYLLSRIAYTGHTSGAEPQRQVVFEYELRPDVSFAYESGIRFSQRYRLRKMRMFAPDPQETREVWSYTLAYVDSPSTQRSLLQSVTRCEAGGACLWSKQFHYDMTPGVELEPIVISDDIAPEVLQGTHDTRFVVGDFDGNGMDDLLYRKAPGLVKLRRSLGGMLDTPTTTPFKDLSHMELTDHNGDGATDVLGIDRAQGWKGFRLFLWDAATADFQMSGPLIKKEDITDENFQDFTDRVELADMNGDARLDLLSFFRPPGGAVENWKLFLSDGSWFGAPADTGVSGVCSLTTGTISTDLDADGRADFLTGNYPCDVMQALTLDESGVLVPKPAWGISPGGEQEMVLADLNGDGLKDAVYFAGTGQGASVRWNTGNGFLPNSPLSNTLDTDVDVVGDRGSRVADIDGDGREDIVAFRHAKFGGADDIVIHSFRGTDIMSIHLPWDPGTAGQYEGWSSSQLGDFDGDGLLDIVQVDGATRVLRQVEHHRDRLWAVSDEGDETPRELFDYTNHWWDGAPASQGCAYPVLCSRRGMPVVWSHKVYQGALVGSYRRTFYTYDEPRADVRGRGFLGFGKVVARDPDRPTETTHRYDLATSAENPVSHVVVYPYAGLAYETTEVTGIFEEPVDGAVLPHPFMGTARVVRTSRFYDLRWGDGERTFTAPLQRWKSEEWEENVAIYPNGSMLLLDSALGNVTVQRTREGSQSYDDYGSVLSAQTWTHGGLRQVTVRQYDNDLPNWQIGKLRVDESNVYAEGTPNPPDARRTEIDYDAEGRVEEVRLEPLVPELYARTRFDYTPFGLAEWVLVEGYQVSPARHVYVEYDALEGAFPTQVGNDLGHWTSYAIDPRFGQPAVVADTNGGLTTVHFDGFGRVRSVDTAGAGTRDVVYLGNDVDIAGEIAGLRTVVVGTDGSMSETRSDELGRVTGTLLLGFDAADVIETWQRYNLFGRATTASQPGLGGASSYATTTRYDSLGRTVRVVGPDGATTTLDHSLFVTSVVGPTGQEHVDVRDADDRPVLAAEIAGGQLLATIYGYDFAGRLASITDPKGNVVTMGFDKLGRRTSLVDPDAGASVYGYNGLDELVMQKDAEDLQDPADPGTVLVRDRAGRVTQRSDDDGLTKYVWDTAPHGMGQLRTATSPDGVLTAYSYDVYGREEAVTTTVAGAAYEVRRSFDPEGRVDRVFYPEVPGRPRLTLANHYNVRGYLDSVTDVSFGVGAPPFALLAGRNAGLAPTAMLLGDGSLVGRDYDPATGRLTHVEVSGPAPLAIDTTYHPDGNLKTRDEPLLGRFEVFSYDALDRLSEWTLTASNAETTTTYDYDELGNLTRVWKGAQVVTHNLYGANGKPHALSSDLYGLFSPNQYDARGRLVSGRGRALTYNEANLPLTVTTSQGTTGFGYDAFGKRTWKEAPTGQTLYVGELYERRAAGGLVEHVFHVVGPTGVVADVVYDEASTTEEVVYLQQDGLGSTVQTQGAFGASRQYFEPFGARIDADGTAAPPQPVDTVGFTGHLHDDDLGLIAMRGRIYDPGMRRFLTPDPVVQAPFFGQSYNRYAYVMNNPLRYVDPSGFQAVGAGEEPSTSAPGALDGPQINPGGQDAQAQPECGGGLVTGCVITVYVHGTKPGSANKTAESAGENGAPSTPTPAGGTAPDDSEDLGALASAFGHGGTAGTVPFGGLFIRQERGATPAQQFAYGLGEFMGGFLTMVVAPFTGGTPGVSNPGDKAAPLVVGPGGVAVLSGVGAKVTVGVRIAAVAAAVLSGAIAATDGMATMSSALGSGGGDGTPRGRVVSNSGGKDVFRTLVRNEDELLAAAEKRAGGSLGTWREYKPGWWESPDGRTRIEFSLDGHANVNEGPHVTVRQFDGQRHTVVEKIFIEGRETFR